MTVAQEFLYGLNIPKMRSDLLENKNIDLTILGRSGETQKVIFELHRKKLIDK